jgi:dephospho-CoA kinase
MQAPAYVVALTGGIASGKSAVTERFEKLGVEVIDADRVARELVAPGQPALDEIASAFGADVLDADGTLDRRRMRERVFADPSARRRLEAILHPRVRTELHERARLSTAPYVVLAIPLLAESEGYDWIDRVLVVDVPRETQRQRLIARDGITPQLADAMLYAQASRERRLAIADDVVDNHGALSDLDAQIATLHRRYLSEARRQAAR